MSSPARAPQKSALLCSTRLNLALVSFLGCVIIYALRSNLSFAIVCMVKPAPASSNEDSGSGIGKTKSKCPTNMSFFSSREDDSKLDVVGEFDWPKNMQGSLLSAFFWGYLTSQVLGGYLASRIGSKLVIGVAVLLSSTITLFSPIAAHMHVWVFFALRVVLGFAQGSIFPAMHSMWSLWAPPLERSILTGISYAGAQIGNVLVMPLSGFLCRYGYGGWESIFYTLGIAGIVWCVLWWLFSADSPHEHRRMAETERDYIVESLGSGGSSRKGCVENETEVNQASKGTRRRKNVPVMKILSSPAVWAIFVGHFAGDWGAYTMATSLPSFLNDVLGLNLTSMGMISSVPYVAYFLMINFGGFLSDKLRDSGALSTVNTRRLAMLIALGGQALFLVAIVYCKCGQELLVVILLTLSVGISGLQYAGFVVNYLDICPAYAGTVLGIGNTLSCFAGVISPLCMGWLTPTGSKEEWRMVFFLTAAILIFGALFFAAFAKGEVQPWALGTEIGEDGHEGVSKEANEEGVVGSNPPAIEPLLVAT